LRIAIGTALAVGVASSAAVVLGRIGTAQIPWLLTAVTGQRRHHRRADRLGTVAALAPYAAHILAGAIFLTAI